MKFRKLKERIQTNDALTYFVVYGISVLFAFFKTLYSAFVLAPEQMGWFISLTLVAALMIYACNLGVMDAYLIRTGRIQRRESSAALLRGQLYLVAIVMSGVMTVLMLSCTYFYLPTHGPAPNLALAAAYLFFQPLQTASFIDLQADRRLRKYSSYTLIKSTAPLVAIATARMFSPENVDLNCILICEIATSAALFLITLADYRRNIIFKPRWPLMLQLARQGSFFTAQAMLNNLATNLDKWFVITIYGLAAAGAYSISNQLMLVGTTIAGMVTTYMIPSMAIRQANRSEVIKLYNTWSALLAATTAALSITVIYIIWEYITHYYSRYTLSFGIFMLASATMAFIGANFYEAYFRVTNSGRWYFYIHAGSTLLLITLLMLVYLLNLDLHWVAFSVLIAKMLTWVMCRNWVARHSKLKCQNNNI